MRRTVLADIERIVREHPDGGQLHERRKADRRTAVVGEHEECRAERTVAAVCGDAVDDRAHGELADAKVDVASGEVSGGKPAMLLHAGLVGRLKVGRTADEVVCDLGESVHDGAVRRTRGDALRGIELGKSLVEIVRGIARRGSIRSLRLLRPEPHVAGAVAICAALLEHVVDVVRNLKALLGIETEIPLEPCKLFCSERSAMDSRRVALRGSAETDGRLGDDDHRHIRDLEGTAIHTVDLSEVVSVALQDLPSIAFETLLRVVRHRKLRGALDCDSVRIINERKTAELEVAGEGASLVGNALFKIAVAAENPCVVAVAVLAGGERETDTHRDTLTERSGGHFDARHHAALGMTRATGTELTESLHLIHLATLHTGEVQKRIYEHGRVASREHQTVANRPINVLGIEIEELEPQ